jgi:predicted SAM-dependent methyltransferase
MKLHLGCGWRNFGEDWIHIDGGDYDHLDYKDITKLPFEDDSVDLIYSSHVIEYFNRSEINEVLKEWRRVLKPGKTLRIAVPDFERMSELYLQKAISLNQILGPLYGKMQMGNYSIYHKTTYDFNSLSEVLIQNGFNEIERYDWKKTEHANFDDHSQAYIPHMDKEKGVLISLNIECIK